jgi:hypothetical protein
MEVTEYTLIVIKDNLILVNDEEPKITTKNHSSNFHRRKRSV